MAPWRAVGRVVAGTFTTVLLSASTVLLLPFLGFATADLVGNWLPLWVFAVPLMICPIAGGAVTGFLQANDWKRCTILGSLAAALGITVLGVAFGLLALLIMLGMTPAYGPAPDLSKAALVMAALGGGTGFVTGAVFGAIGGVGAYVARQALGS